MRSASDKLGSGGPSSAYLSARWNFSGYETVIESGRIGVCDDGVAGVTSRPGSGSRDDEGPPLAPTAVMAVGGALLVRSVSSAGSPPSSKRRLTANTCEK